MSSPRPLRADARRNREALLAAAREAFLSEEPGVGVEEIAKRAGLAVGTLYRHFETRDAVVEAVYRLEVDELCAASQALLEERPPEAALREFLLLLIEHAAVGKGMAAALESIMATDSPVFDQARSAMVASLDRLLAAGAATGTVRGDVSGRTVLRALGSICGMRATDGWRDDALSLVTLLFDGLRYSAAGLAPRPRTTDS